MKKTVKKIFAAWRWYRDREGRSPFLFLFALILWIFVSIVSWAVIQEIPYCACCAVLGMVITGFLVYYWKEYQYDTENEEDD